MIKPPSCHVKIYMVKRPSWIGQLTSRTVTELLEYIISQTVARTLATEFPSLLLKKIASLSSLSQLFGAEFENGLSELKRFLACSR